MRSVSADFRNGLEDAHPLVRDDRSLPRLRLRRRGCSIVRKPVAGALIEWLLRISVPGDEAWSWS